MANPKSKIDMRRLFALFIFLIYLLALPSSSLAQEPAFVPGEILVKFRTETALSAAGTILQSQGLRPLEVSSYSGVMRVAVTPGREAEVISALSAQPGVQFAELNRIVTTAGPPNDTFFGNQWGLDNIGQIGGLPGADIDALAAWALQTGSSQVIIGVVDTGILLNHEDLQSKIWINQDEVAGNGLDDDGNGFEDDRRGWDFCNSNGTNCDSPPDNDPNDEDGHGTHVAGIAAAAGNNGRGIAGVSWGATLMAVKSLDKFGRGTTNSIAEGINYAVANGADVINLSVQSSGSQFPCSGFETVRLAMQNALQKRILVIASAGNQNASTLSCPAALTEAFAVGATSYDDSRWVGVISGSNRGPQLDVMAPGDTIYSTIKGPAPEIQYGYLSGTSLAVPHVSGLVALLLSSKPGLAPHELREIIEATAEDLGSPGYDVEYGHGRINARYALESAIGLQTTPAQTFVVVDDGPGLVPAIRQIQLTSGASTPVTWRATISPTVSWLSLTAPVQGTISGVSSPLSLSLTVTRPVTYGLHSATVVITGTNNSGIYLGARKTVVKVRYVSAANRFFLPLIVK
jgi:subtilisin family serine protease